MQTFNKTSFSKMEKIGAADFISIVENDVSSLHLLNLFG